MAEILICYQIGTRHKQILPLYAEYEQLFRFDETGTHFHN